MTNLSVIKKPRITEKAAISAELQSAYVFEVTMNAGKKAIEAAIKELYKVNPTKINIVKLPAKKVISKGKRGRTNAVKKAYVYLKKGEKIELN